jgi:hypothetical protein
MDTTQTTETTTIAVEDMKVGYRYWAVRPGYESNWTIASVQTHTAEYEVDRGDGWFSPTLVTVTRRDGDVRVFEKGEQLSIMGPWKAEDTEAEAWAAVETAQLAHNATAQTRRDADDAYRNACDQTRGWDRMTAVELDAARDKVQVAREQSSIARKAERTAWTAYAVARSNPALPY